VPVPTPPSDGGAAAADGPVGTLRGAGVDVDARTVATVAGARKNSQIDELRSRGIPVSVTVTTCLGLLGGSGSNPAGYSCQGTFVLDGRRVTDPVPGLAEHAPGDVLHLVTVASDPGLVATPSVLATEHASADVYLAPAVLVVVAAAVGAGWVWVRRRARGSVDG
jgi:hypothetical protein